MPYGNRFSDFSIWNTASFPILKDTVVTFTSSGAGKNVYGQGAEEHCTERCIFERRHHSEQILLGVLDEVADGSGAAIPDCRSSGQFKSASLCECPDKRHVLQSPGRGRWCGPDTAA
jgi:hypothetical protein